MIRLFRWNFAGDVLSRLEAFEREVALYTTNTGGTVSDKQCIGLVLNQLDDSALKDHLLMNAASLKDWPLFREELVDILCVRNAPQPMDVGGLGKGGKGGGGKGARSRARHINPADSVPVQA